MKTQHIIFLFLIGLLIISGCREITVTTRVNKDGSFTRFIKITGDSADVFRTDLPYPIDETWSRNSVKDSSEKGDYIMVYTKSFKTSDQLNIEIKQDTGWMKDLKRNVSINKRFGFFYSYITFSETYQAINPFVELNYPNSLTDEEKLFLTGNKIPLTSDDSTRQKQVADKFEELLIKALANEIIITMEEGIVQLNDPLFNTDQLENYRDSIEHKLEEYHVNMYVYIDFYKEWTGNESFDKLKTLKPPLFDTLDNKVSFLLNAIFMDSYSQTVEVPGLITETNAKSVTGNKVSWNINSDQFFFDDYEMKVESRVVNIWAFLISGILVFAAIILLFIKINRR